ncbi:hypothetical protein [Dyella terrae]|nr:hypothetical protein [Dyella terrae]
MVAQSASIGATQLDRYFARDIFPNFPFRNRHWLAVAFDRQAFPSRMPRWFFDLLVQTYTPTRAPISIYARNPDGTEPAWWRHDVPLEWSAYESVVTGENSTAEFRMLDPLGRWACWSTNEVTVWGGEAEDMMIIYERMGGRDRVRQSMFNSLHAYAAHLPSLAKYVRGLVDAAGRE